MTAPTPAVERARAAIIEQWDAAAVMKIQGSPESFADSFARRAVTAALTDPDDPDSLARTLYVLHSGVAGWRADESLTQWHAYADTDREPWRAFADGLRMMLTGSGS